ncbi:MAG: hypothetical protein QXM22_01035 [Candidatus Bathyarchaeia archaeon]
MSQRRLSSEEFHSLWRALRTQRDPEVRFQNPDVWRRLPAEN